MKMDLFDHEFYKLNKLYLSLVGFWPNQKKYYKIFAKLSIMAIFVIFEITQYLKLKNSELNVGIITQMFITALMGFNYFVKIVFFWIFFDELFVLINHMKRDWMNLSSQAEIEILIKSASIGRDFISKFRYYLHIAIILYIFIPTLPAILNVVSPLNESRPLDYPFEAMYPFDADEYYLIVITHMIISTLVGHLAALAIDMLQMTYLHHACGMFDVVGYRLRHTFDGITDKNRNSVNYYKNIVDTVNCHKDILQFVDVINKCYGWPCLVQCTIFAGISSMIMLQIVLSYKEWNEAFSNMLFLLDILCLMVFNIYSTQNLLDHSILNFHDIYNSQWYQASPNLQKLILIILSKTKTPSAIYAGKFYVLSLESLGSIVQMTVSYFAVLYSVH